VTITRRPGPWVFLILFASYAFFWHSRDWNSASRLMLTYAMVDRGTLSIDGLEGQTGDIARYHGRYFTDKTPGFSLLAAVPYAAARRAFGLPDHPLGRPGFPYWPADYWATLGTSGLLSAIAGVILVGLARDLGCGPGRAALVGLSYGLATPAYAYATLAYGHQPAAAALLGSFALLWRDGPRPRLRAALAGVLAGYAAVVEIQVGPVSAILGFYLIARAIGGTIPGPAVLTFGLGAAVPSAILLTYNYLAFDSPWKMGYFFLILDRFKKVHSAGNPLGLSRPDWSKLPELLWGERRGLVGYAPILLLTAPGLVALWARRFRGMAVVASATMAVILLVNLGYPEWTGGWTTGPRLLVPMIPFAMMPVAALLAVGGRGTTALAVALAMAGAVVLLLFQGVGARVPDGIDRPLVDGVWPLWRGDVPLPPWAFGNRFARNLVGLARPGAGRSMFLPLVLFQAGMIGLMLRSVRGTAQPSGPVTPADRPPSGDLPGRSPRVDLPRHGRPDAVGGQLGHAFEPGAGPDEARGAPDAAPDGDGPGAVGPGPIRAGAGVDPDHPRPGGGGQVERPGVV